MTDRAEEYPRFPTPDMVGHLKAELAMLERTIRDARRVIARADAQIEASQKFMALMKLDTEQTQQPSNLHLFTDCA